METKKQIMFGSGAIIGVIGLYFVWSFYSGTPKKPPVESPVEAV